MFAAWNKYQSPEELAGRAVEVKRWIPARSAWVGSVVRVGLARKAS